MEEKDQIPQEFDLEDIMREFGGTPMPPAEPEPESDLEPELTAPEQLDEAAPGENAPVAQEIDEILPENEEERTDSPEDPDIPAPEESEESTDAPLSPVTGDTIRLDTIAQAVEAAGEQIVDAVDTDEAEQPEEPEEEFIPPAPIPFHTPRSRLHELKKKLVAGPEKRYYELSEIGLGRLQVAMAVNLVVVLLCAAGTLLYAFGMIPENRIKLMIFSQFLGMMISVLLGCHCIIDGVADLFKGRFSLNIMLLITFAACTADMIFCLNELRIPCCASFCLSVSMSLWGRYQQRNTEMGQMDTMRKAVRLTSVVKEEDFFQGKPGLLRGEGQVEDFMDNYNAVTGPEKIRFCYALISTVLCAAMAICAAALHDSISLGVQVFSTSLLVAVPSSFFIALERPMAVLERRLHMVGTVLCGWQGVKGLCGHASFPLSDTDLFPVGAAKLNGVKFYSERKSDQVIAYATALIRRCGGGLEPVFTQLCQSRECPEYDAENFQNYPGGIGGEVCEESVLIGSADLLRNMGVEIPEGTMVSQALYCSIDGQLAAVFAISYAKMKSAAAGMVTLCGYRNLTPVLTCGDFMIDEGFLRSKFAVNTRHVAFPDRAERELLRSKTPGEDSTALAMTTQEGLASAAYAVTGARALYSATRLGLILHILGGIVGMLIMAVLAYLGSTALLTPLNVLLYQLIWMIPGLLVTEWTRTV